MSPRGFVGTGGGFREVDSFGAVSWGGLFAAGLVVCGGSDAFKVVLRFGVDAFPAPLMV
jgi:hypothetical protein